MYIDAPSNFCFFRNNDFTRKLIIIFALEELP